MNSDRYPSRVLHVAIAVLGLVCLGIPGTKTLWATPDDDSGRRVIDDPPVEGTGASNDNTVLILGSSVKDGLRSVEAVQAIALGFTVEIATDERWSAKSQENFAAYRAIVIGDRRCEDPTMLAVARANALVWSAAATGNVIAVGTHPSPVGRTRPGADALVRNAIQFAADAETTGAYITAGCIFSASPGSEVPILEGFGNFRAVYQPGCPGAAHIVAQDPALVALTDADLSKWERLAGGCDGDIGFVEWPSAFDVVAISEDVPSGFVGPDGSSGSPYILARGGNLSGLRCGDGVLNPTEACDDGNRTGGDGCSSSCRLEGPALGVPEIQTVVPEVEPLNAVTATTNLQFSGSETVQNIFGAAICDACAPDALFGGDDVGAGVRVNVDVNADWSPTARIDHQFSTGLLRQGETLDLVNTFTGGSGPLTISYDLTGDVGVYFNSNFPADASQRNTFGVNLSTTGTGTCGLRLNNDGVYSCEASKEFTILNIGLIPGVDAVVKLIIRTTLSITPDGVVTVRRVRVSGTVVNGPDTLTFNGPSPSVVPDNLVVGCTAPVGASAIYELASPSTDPSAFVTTNVDVNAKLEIVILPDIEETFTLVTVGPTGPTTLNLTAPTEQLTLGSIQADNRPPMVDANGPYAGDEGTPVHFSAAGTTDNCAATLSHVWNYSDGGIAFGVSPFHTFTDNMIFSGQCVVTDLAGNSASQAFSVDIANLAPFAEAGPDTTEAWNVPVAFNGSGTDPGAGDQSTLTFRWSFGDGTPSATGGPSVMHPYAQPGTYTATFRVCDKDFACSFDSRTVNVRKRNVSAGYLGAHSGTFDTMTTISASLVDEFGVSVPGRMVSLAIGPEAVGTPTTNGSGIASQNHLLGLDAGSYTAAASFGGDALYEADSDSAVFTVFHKATTLTYTGSLGGGPNKTIVLSAVLLDITGTPLAGRTVNFNLGAQSASAITGIDGVATTTLRLNQHNGSYPLKASFTPAGADTTRYLGSTDSETFSIGGGN